MPIPVSCPSCRTNLQAPDKAAGRQVRCPKCNAALAVPVPQPVPVPLDDPVVSMPARHKMPAGKPKRVILIAILGGGVLALLLVAMLVLLLSGVFSSPGRVRVNVAWNNTAEKKLEPDEETIVVLAPAGVDDDLQRMYAPPSRASGIAEYQNECRKKGGYAAVGRGGQVVIENVKPGTYCLVVVSTKPGIYNDPAYLRRTKELMTPYFNSITLDTTSPAVAMHHVEVIQVRGGKETAVSHTF
jgi:LSD1 subclass zinc finger protein